MAKNQNVEIVVSFDTTGSMYPCLTQTRRNIKSLVERLFREIPGIKVGIIAHGDYCDLLSTYVTKHLGLTSDKDAITRFVEQVGPTGGGDSEECYELVIHEARNMGWSSGATKAFVMIGDDVPHGPNYGQNTKRLDWRNELQALNSAGIRAYGVQALGRRHATKFYQEIASLTGGFHLELDQFNAVTELLLAICYKQDGDVTLGKFEDELVNKGRMTRSLNTAFEKLLPDRDRKGRFVPRDFTAVDPGRFQVMDVDNDTRIDQFVTKNGLLFQQGRGFYQLSKYENAVQPYKEIILEDKKTGDMFSGARARALLGLSTTETVSLSPKKVGENGDAGLKYNIFIQSTSLNRNLKAGTRFLYEVDSTR